MTPIFSPIGGLKKGRDERPRRPPRPALASPFSRDARMKCFDGESNIKKGACALSSPLPKIVSRVTLIDKKPQHWRAHKGQGRKQATKNGARTRGVREHEARHARSEGVACSSDRDKKGKRAAANNTRRRTQRRERRDAKWNLTNRMNERRNEQPTPKEKRTEPKNTHMLNQVAFCFPRSLLAIAHVAPLITVRLAPRHPSDPTTLYTHAPPHTRTHNKEQHETRTSALVAVLLLLLVPLHVLRQSVDPLALVDPLAVHVHGLGQVYGWMDIHTWV